MDNNILADEYFARLSCSFSEPEKNTGHAMGQTATQEHVILHQFVYI